MVDKNVGSRARDTVLAVLGGIGFLSAALIACLVIPAIVAIALFNFGIFNYKVDFLFCVTVFVFLAIGAFKMITPK